MKPWDIYKQLKNFYPPDFTVRIHHREWQAKQRIQELDLLHDLKILAKWTEQRHKFYKLINPQFSPHFGHIKNCKPCETLLNKKPCKPCLFVVRRYFITPKQNKQLCLNL